MTASWKAAASWPLLTFALWACCLLQIRCEPAAPQPIDAGAPAVLDMSAPQLLDLMPVAPACVPCSWTAPYMGCDPSLCARVPGGQLCCVQRRGRRRRKRDTQKTWSPRSLVGMSMGARKRRRDLMAWQYMFDLPEDQADGGFWKADQHRRQVLHPAMRIGQRLRPCLYWNPELGCDCRGCKGGGVLASRRGIAKTEWRRLKRRDRAEHRAYQDQKRAACTHSAREWIDAGRKCPSQDERGICNGIPF